MNAQLNQAYFTGEEYLELERQSSLKHEFQRGLIYAMASTPKKTFEDNSQFERFNRQLFA
jgi:Uma2 family endonuclease